MCNKSFCRLNFQDTIRYELIGNDRAKEFYFLDSLSGLITIKKLMTEGSHPNDEVI